MDQLSFPFAETPAKLDVKEMLSVTTEGVFQVIRMNYSSLDIIQTCMRKAEFSLHKKLTSRNEAPALTFGKGFHKAMEVWYCTPKAHRKQGSPQCDDSHALMLSGQSPLLHAECARCSSVFAFLEQAKHLGEEMGARSAENGINILNNYFDTYLDDPYELLSDKDGPLCERSFEFPIWRGLINGKDSEIRFFGQIDSILQNRETKEVYVCDHKTTSSVGKDFLNRIKPNFQYVGYWWAAHEVLGLHPTQFMVNGVQVAKTKQELHRQFTTITQEEIEELRSALIWNAKKYSESLWHSNWVMSTPNACSQWGGCNFKQLCELPRELHASVIQSNYSERGVANG